MHGRTSFVIAQRLTTVRDADQVLVFEGGRITQQGTHDELLRDEDGFYHELYTLQMQDQEVAGEVLEEIGEDVSALNGKDDTRATGASRTAPAATEGGR